MNRTRARQLPDEVKRLHYMQQRGRWCSTRSGCVVDLDDPSIADIRIEDIAHHLSLICRFGGACREFYSVAQHSVLVSYHVLSSMALDGLMHDAAEAYVGDVIQPIKSALEHFARMEATVHRAIAARFGLSVTIPEGVKTADRRLLTTERQQLMTDAVWPGDGVVPAAEPIADLTIEPLPPAAARRLFMHRFEELHAR